MRMRVSGRPVHRGDRGNPGRPEMVGPEMVGMVGIAIQKHGDGKRFWTSVCHNREYTILISAILENANLVNAKKAPSRQ